MYEELCWVNTFFQQGTFSCNWGYRYYTELVNPIPRFLWPGKPLIGLDYALARGQGGSDDPDSGGVYATISTGMIGQGVVNFGTVVGPAFAALLMSGWVVILARLDLRIHEFGRLPLYGLGLALTLNLGRDIILGTLYPFIFGVLLVWWHERSQPGQRLAMQPVNRPKAQAQLLPGRRRTSSRSVRPRWKRSFATHRKGNGNSVSPPEASAKSGS